MSTIDENVISSLLAVMRGLEAPLSKHVTAEGLTAAQFTVLEIIFHKGELTINQIIEGVFSTSGNITVVINNLVKAGFLEKKHNPKDGRSRLIGLTPAGVKKIKDYYPSHRNEIQRLLSGASNSEKRALINALTSLRKNIENNTPTKDLK